MRGWSGLWASGGDATRRCSLQTKVAMRMDALVACARGNHFPPHSFFPAGTNYRQHSNETGDRIERSEAEDIIVKHYDGGYVKIVYIITASKHQQRQTMCASIISSVQQTQPSS
jgi:hypothetical protein